MVKLLLHSTFVCEQGVLDIGLIFVAQSCKGDSFPNSSTHYTSTHQNNNDSNSNNIIFLKISKIIIL